MAGPGGAEVGRVHIKVVPDFTHFRKEMLEELRKWDGREVTIKVKADNAALAGITRDLSKAAKQSSKNISKEVSKGLRKASKDAAAVTPTINSKTLTKRRLQNQLNKLFSDLEIKLNLDKASVDVRDYWDKEFDSVQKKLNKLKTDGPTPLFNADTRFIAAQLKQLRDLSGQVWDSPEVRQSQIRYRSEVQLAKNDIKNMNRELLKMNQMWEDNQKNSPLDNLKGDVGHKENLQAMREYIHGFRTLNGEVKRIATTTEQHLMRSTKSNGLFAGIVAAGGGLAAAVKGMKDLGHAVSETTKAAGGLSKGLSPQGLGLNVSMAGFVLWGSLIGLVVAPAIGLLTTALLTIPGILATIMAPIGATILGFNGIKKAAENAGLFGDKNGDKKGGGTLGKALEELKKNTEGVFERTLTEPFKKIGEAANALVAPMQTVAQGVADVMSDIINTITSEANVSRIVETFKSIGLQLTNSFGPGLADFTDGLIGLAAEFTKPGGALEGIGRWFKDTMGDFKAWVEEGIKTGSLTEQFGNLGTTLKTVLDTIGGMAQQGLNFVGDQSKMNGFIETLKGIGTALENIVKISNDIGGLWDAIMPAWNIGQGIVDIMQGDGRNAWRNFKEAFGASASEDASKIAVDFSSTLAEGVKAGVLLGNPLQGLNEASNEELNRLAHNIAQAGTQGVEQLNQAITAGDVEAGVAQQIQAKVGAAVTGALQAMEPLKQGLQTDINAALAPLGDIAGRIDAAFSGIGGQIAGSLGKIPGQVGTSLMGVGVAAETSMAGLVTAVQQACDNALLAATFMAPKIIQPFRDLGGQMAGLGADMMAGLGQGITANVGVAKAAAETAAAEVLAAAKAAVRSKSPSKDFMDLGRDTQTGLAIGIQNNADGPISAIREVMQAIKDVFGTAEGINLNFFLGQAASSMSTLADTSREFRTNMTEAVTAPQVSSDLANVDLNDIKRQKAEIDLRLAELTAQKNATQDKVAKAAIQGEMDQLRIQKERLDLLKEENGLQEERKTAIQKLSDTIATSIVDTIMMPGEFAKATTNAAMQDLGISGTGALPTIANWALDAGTNFIFNVNNMDDAIQGQQAQQRKQTAGIAGR